MSNINIETFKDLSSLGDNIATLPVDNSPISDNDKKILSTFFAAPETHELINRFKDPFIGGVLFMVLSMPYVDKYIIDRFFMNKSVYTLLLIKGIAFAVIFYIIKNIKKNNNY